MLKRPRLECGGKEGGLERPSHHDVTGIRRQGCIPIGAALAAVAALSGGIAPPAHAQQMPSMDCGTVQTNAHIRCTAIGVNAFTRERRAYWSEVPARENLSHRYVDESECHAIAEARCDRISALPSSYSTLVTFDQALGSQGCEAGATGNGWIDPYLAWRAKLVLPRRFDERTWLVTIVTSTLTAATIRAYPNADVAIAPCHLMITGTGTSKDIEIPRAGASTAQRQTLSRFGAGEYLAELQCPAIQGSDCRLGRASVSLQITVSPND